MRNMLLLAVAAASVVPMKSAMAQVTVRTAPGAFAYVLGDPDRAMIGVSTQASGKRDTLGLLVASVTRRGPAEAAGIEEGDRLVSVNGVNLRLSPMDAGEADMNGVATRRLVRELEKVKAGDEVALRVYRDGATRDVRVKAVTASELNDTAFETVTSRGRRLGDRAVLGVSLGGSGSRRDTLGILVIGVTDSGPAMRAGIEEGDRIASINGVELRVAREDAGDHLASQARVNRLNREIGKLAAGDAAELRVYSAGQYRTVRVEAVKASDLNDRDGFWFNNFNGTLRANPPAVVVPRRSGAELEPFALRDLELESTRGGITGAVQNRMRLEEAKRQMERVLSKATAARRSF